MSDSRAGGRLHRHSLCSLAGRYQKYSVTALRVSVGLLFVWFGILKLLPGNSPAEDVATRAMSAMTFGQVAPEVSRPLLAGMEILIGAGLITGLLLRLTLLVFFVHMSGVFLTLAILHGEMWNGGVAFPTLAGQYILKNIVLVVAVLTVAADALAARPAPPDRGDRDRAGEEHRIRQTAG
ncbi:DoxX family membrane protein [Streptomyces sp. ACA25]|uniref:DoxX family membrane protein n=1 Tax=Streptomyces sp. ACA25 TaxID=3022596 RepID=UPI002307F184|nr:DoxX family membrane protein [Streptomyces sp. ACA25]MDB1090038.1 DoxX family membrane protein [Streptomyces sp. ACA25]